MVVVAGVGQILQITLNCESVYGERADNFFR